MAILQPSVLPSAIHHLLLFIPLFSMSSFRSLSLLIRSLLVSAITTKSFVENRGMFPDCMDLLTIHMWPVLFPSLYFSSVASVHLHQGIFTLLLLPYLWPCFAIFLLSFPPWALIHTLLVPTSYTIFCCIKPLVHCNNWIISLSFARWHLCIRQLAKIKYPVMGVFKVSQCTIMPKICKLVCKLVGIWMQLSCLILQVKNWVVDFITRCHYWCYILFVQYRDNRCVQNKTMFTCTKNQANWLRRFKDIDSQT